MKSLLGPLDQFFGQPDFLAASWARLRLPGGCAFDGKIFQNTPTARAGHFGGGFDSCYVRHIQVLLAGHVGFPQDQNGLGLNRVAWQKFWSLKTTSR